MDHSKIMSRIIRSYDSAVVRAYCWGRFKILRQRFLDEIGQYLPEEGVVLDVGSGIGMFGMYFAQQKPGLTIRGFDLAQDRINVSRKAASKLGLDNIQFDYGKAEEFRAQSGSGCQAIYILDVIHHMPPEAVQGLIHAFYETLEPGGRLLVKEVDTKPTYKRLFTHVLDLMMDPKHPPHYVANADMRAMLRAAGFTVYQHAMIDYLPYPHMLYVCEKPA